MYRYHKTDICIRKSRHIFGMAGWPQKIYKFKFSEFLNKDLKSIHAALCTRLGVNATYFILFILNIIWYPYPRLLIKFQNWYKSIFTVNGFCRQILCSFYTNNKPRHSYDNTTSFIDGIRFYLTIFQHLT